MTEDSKYNEMKVNFEKEYCLVGATFLKSNGDGTYLQYSLSQIKILTSNFVLNEYDNYTGKKKNIKFIDKWLEDPQRRSYECTAFYPDISKCPSNTLNLFTGFKGDEYNKSCPRNSFEDDHMLCQPTNFARCKFE